MTERVLVLVVLAAVVAAAVFIAREWSRRKVHSLTKVWGSETWQNLGEQPDGRRALVSFSTPSCAACHTAQAPAVKAVESQLGPESVRVIKIDTARQPDVARAFGVLTVPSTIVLAPSGQVVAVNQGFAPSRRLVEQLQRA
jgi:thioredoxin-like negative regulator of GroEL